MVLDVAGTPLWVALGDSMTQGIEAVLPTGAGWAS